MDAKCKSKNCEYRNFLKFLSKHKGTLYFEETISKKELTTIIVGDVISTGPTFWSAVELFKRRWGVRKKK